MNTKLYRTIWNDEDGDPVVWLHIRPLTQYKEELTDHLKWVSTDVCLVCPETYRAATTQWGMSYPYTVPACDLDPNLYPIPKIKEKGKMW